MINLGKIKNSKNEERPKIFNKELPQNFFEKLVDLELKVKKNFSMDILEELISLYSLAIEYYESIENPRYRDYQSRLNLLIIQPDVLKKMDNPKYSNRQNSNKVEDLQTRIKGNQTKNELKLKINYNSRLANNSNNETEIRNIIINYDKQKKVPKDIINIDLNQQQFNFKSRLKAKQKNNHCLEKPYNSLSTDPSKKSSSSNIDLTATVNSVINTEASQVDNKEESSPLDENNIKKDELTSMYTPEENIDENMFIFQYFNKKQKAIFKEIKVSIQSFLKEYHNFYHQNIFNNFKIKCKKIMEEKFKIYTEVYENYNNHIKEVEFIKEDENDDPKKIPIESIIESLKEEQQHELDLIEYNYEKLYDQSYSNFKNNAKESKFIQLLEEKLRLDIYTQINNIIKPNNKF